MYVDVDETFVRSHGDSRTPIPHVLEHIRQMHAAGATLYCWSSGGADYAASSAREFGIDKCFTAFLPKPNVALDDQAFEQWRYLLQVHPNECHGQSIDSYWHRIRLD